MWIRESSVELRAEKQSRLLRSSCLDVLLGASLWFALVRLSAVMGLADQGPVSGYIACGVVAIILPARWLTNLGKQPERAQLMICDRCHVLETATDQLECSCGGKYHFLPEIKCGNDTASL
jgi:hypothetical protein